MACDHTCHSPADDRGHGWSVRGVAGFLDLNKIDNFSDNFSVPSVDLTAEGVPSYSSGRMCLTGVRTPRLWHEEFAARISRLATARSFSRGGASASRVRRAPGGRHSHAAGVEPTEARIAAVVSL